MCAEVLDSGSSGPGKPHPQGAKAPETTGSGTCRPSMWGRSSVSIRDDFGQGTQCPLWASQKLSAVQPSEGVLGRRWPAMDSSRVTAMGKQA